VLYTLRALITLSFLVMPISPTTTLVFAAVMGLTWLGTVPLTSGVVAQMFGVTYIGTLIGVVFFMHQVGSFLGAWLGGLAFEMTGSYEAVWWSVVVLGIVAALIHLAIDERPTGHPLERPVAA
jgi:predicted MFS family arabinose efflux permease